MTLDVLGAPGGRAGPHRLGAQRGDRREGGPRADARGRRRGRRPAAVALGLRRGGVGDADRLDGVRVLRRRAGGLAERARPSRWCRSARTPCSPGRWCSRRRRVVALEVLASGAEAVLACDGRRTLRAAARRAGRGAARARCRCCWPAPTRRRSPTRWCRSSACPSRGGAAPRSAGSADAARRGPQPARVPGLSVPGRRVARVLEEMRIRGLGVIEDAVLELAPGLTVVTGETGAGKTMVVQGLSLLFGGRGDAGRVRPGAERGVVEGRMVLPDDAPGRAAGARRRRRARRRRAAGQPQRRRRRPLPGPPRRPRACRSACSPSCPSSSSPCTGRATSSGCCSPPGSAPPSTGSPASRCSALRARFAAPWARWRDVRHRARPADAPRRGSAPARPSCSGSAWPRSRRPAPRAGRGRRAARRDPPAGRRRRAARGGAGRLRGADRHRATPTCPTRWACSPRPAGPSRPARTTTRRSARSATRVAEATYLVADVAGDVASYATVGRGRPGRARPRRRTGSRCSPRWCAGTARTSTRCSPGPSRPRPGCSSSTAPTTGGPSSPTQDSRAGRRARRAGRRR